MRRLMALFAVGALIVGACSRQELTPVTIPASSTTADDPSTSIAGTTEAPPTTTQAPTVTFDPAIPRYGGRVVIGIEDEPATLNPFVPGGENPAVELIGQAHLAGAYDIDPTTLELIPEVVTAIPTVGNGLVVVNADGSMDVTWEIRPEAQWSDGVPITGTDFSFTLDYRAATLQCSGFGVPPDPPPVLEVLAVGEKSFTARFAVASLEYELMFEWLVPAHEVADSDYCEGWNLEMWTAAGPYEVEFWDRDGTTRVLGLARNDNYWKRSAADDPLPFLETVRFDFLSDADDLAGGFTEQRWDIINPRTPIGDLPIEAWQEAGAQIHIVPGPLWEHLNFQFGPDNRNQSSLNRFVEFRKAIVAGIDRQAMLANVNPWLTVADGFLSQFMRAASSEPWARYRHDPELARTLLAEACAKAGRDCEADPPVVVYSTTSNADLRTAVADELQRQLEEVGITVELELEDSQLFFGDTLERGTWDVGGWAWRGSPGSEAIVDFFDRFAPDEPPPIGDNSYRWGSPGSVVEGDEATLQFATILEQLRAELDSARVVDLARQAEELLADQVVIIPLHARLVVGAVWADEIQGFVMNPRESSYTWNIEQWYRIAQ